jgi:hypothetical protein
MTVRFNPDSVDLALDPADTDERPTVYFSLVEVDRATEESAELLQKIYAFDELQRPKNTHAVELRDYFTKRYGLAFRFPLFSNQRNYRFNLRVRFVTTSEARRNELIRLIAQRSQYPAFYHVTTFDRIQNWDTFFTAAHWYPASNYDAILKREDRETRGLKRHTFNAWRDEQIARHVTPVPYFYTTRRTQEEAA